MRRTLRRSSTWIAAAHALLALAACKGQSVGPDASESAAPPLAPVAPAASPTASVAEAPPSATTPVAPPTPSAPGSARPSDAGTSACRLIQGPLAQPLRGAATLVATADGVDLVFNEEGHPRVIAVPGGPIDPAAKPTPTNLPPGAPATYPPCAVAGKFVYCADKGGEVRRTPRAGGPAVAVASSRSGTRIDAAPLGPHAVYTYLASRKTSEGFVSEAWLGVDDVPPVRICEDGSGATAMALAPRAGHLVAAMIDARSALTPVHAREITFTDKLAIGPDAVIFVGGPAERHTSFALATPGDGPAFVLLPIAKDASTFGLASIRVDSPPVVDAPAVWSMYPNGLDPAPVAATRGKTPTRAARVRPTGAEPSVPKVIEIGKLEGDGAFTVQAAITPHGTVTDLAVETDRFGALWVYYADPAGGWLERRACPFQ